MLFFPAVITSALQIWVKVYFHCHCSQEIYNLLSSTYRYLVVLIISHIIFKIIDFKATSSLMFEYRL